MAAVQTARAARVGLVVEWLEAGEKRWWIHFVVVMPCPLASEPWLAAGSERCEMHVVRW